MYYPNTNEEFQSKIIENDYYEWQNIMKTESTNFRKIIFIRDIQKTWYINGVNSKLSSIEKIYEFLKQELIDSDEITMIGNSAGGYAATLFGCLLNVNKIINVSGYILIDEKIYNDPLNPELKKAINNIEKNKWFDITSIINQSTSQIFYFVPIKSEDDLFQYKFFKQHKNVHPILIDSSIHGDGPESICYKYLFQFENKKIIRITQKLTQKFYSKRDFTLHLIGTLQWKAYHSEKKHMRIYRFYKYLLRLTNQFK